MSEGPCKRLCAENNNISQQPDTGLVLGKHCAFAFDCSKDLYAWGYMITNRDPQFSWVDSCSPMLFNPLKKIKLRKIIVDLNFCLMFTDTDVYTLGDDYIHRTIAEDSPKLLIPPYREIWKDIVIREGSFFGLTESGRVYAWGENWDGKLGLSRSDGVLSSFKELKEYSEKWNKIIPGAYHCYGFTQSGKLYVWGCGHHGILGLGLEVTYMFPKSLKPPTGKRWKDISTGAYHSFGFTQDGKVYTWGENEKGQLGLGDSKIKFIVSPRLLKAPYGTKWKNIVCGEGHSLGITYDNKVYGWGDNQHSQAVFESDVKIWYYPVLLGPPSGEKWEIIDTKYNSSFAFTRSGNLYAWGANGKGQLGLGDTKDRDSPTLVKPVGNAKWDNGSIWNLFRILFIARLKEPDNPFYKENLPLDIFKLICIIINKI